MAYNAAYASASCVWSLDILFECNCRLALAYKDIGLIIFYAVDLIRGLDSSSDLVLLPYVPCKPSSPFAKIFLEVTEEKVEIFEVSV